MRSEVTVNLGGRSYPILVGTGLLAQLGELLRAGFGALRVMVITNPTVRNLYGTAVENSLRRAGWDTVWAQMPDGEEHKTLATVETLYDLALDHELDRACPVVALGGGVVGDTAGFFAATYQRGVPFVQVPTTLLAQVDASVGGKVGVNHPRGKNMIGAFYQPRLVVADLDTLATLPLREIRVGLAEIIKYGVIRDAAFFAWLEENLERLLRLEREALAHAVATSCRIKAGVVEEDETEAGLRQILNYGHTVGHALEALTDYRVYHHGEAVAIGMAVAARLAVAMGLLAHDQAVRIISLIRRAGLPSEMPREFSVDELVKAMRLDKKARGGGHTFVLPEAIGSVRIVPRVDVDMIKSVLLEGRMPDGD
ncbi:MAG: 3-dehydroquinate synthase [Desulfotomaculales bacterium]